MGCQDAAAVHADGGVHGDSGCHLRIGPPFGGHVLNPVQDTVSYPEGASIEIC